MVELLNHMGVEIVAGVCIRVDAKHPAERGDVGGTDGVIFEPGIGRAEIGGNVGIRF